MKGKAIYKPAGKAAEYSEWACNFYVGCSGECTYCYLKKGRGAKILGGNTPKLKACFRDETHALEIFEKELQANLSELKQHGLFFSFSTDPMLHETISLTINSLLICSIFSVPVKILTKQVEWINGLVQNESYKFNVLDIPTKLKKKIAFGFTLTGFDLLEPGTSTNNERIEAMRKLHEAGFKTFASIEPIIDFKSSMKMILESDLYCDLFKIGLESGQKYDKSELTKFVNTILAMSLNAKIYFKDSLLKAAGIDRSQLPANCVNRDFKLHES